ncbi:MAG: TolC family protein [Bacteroidaceae bacterium]|nr:TolC family protein [Bacteroidaceae bacterium]
MNTSRIFNMVVLSLTVAVASSQEKTPLWTMDHCMRYALVHSTDVKKKQYQSSTYKAKYQSAVASFFPTVAAGVGGQYNWGRSIDPETNIYNTVTTFNNYYELYSSLSLFDGGQTINLWKQAKINRQQGLNDTQKAKDDKAIEVMQAFVDVVYDEGCIKLATDKLADSRLLLHKTVRQKELGVKGMPDVAEIRAQEAEDDYNLTHQQNLYNTALLKLKSAMNFATSDTLAVDTLLQHLTPVLRVEDADHIYNYASVNNPAARAAILNVENYRLQYNINKGKLLPSISLSAGVTSNYYRNFSSGTNTLPFNSQLKNNIGEYVAATIKIPIFDHTSRSDVRTAGNSVKIALLEKDETLRTLQSDILQALMDRNGYVKEILQMQNKVDADAWAYHVAKRKFEEGMLNAIDMHTSANTLLQSRITLLQKRMLYLMKDRLVDYYNGYSLIKDNK